MTAFMTSPHTPFQRILRSRLLPPTAVALFFLAFYSQQLPTTTNKTIILSTPAIISESSMACPPDRVERWPLSLRSSESRTYSQTMQDGVLEELFRRLGTTNKYYVEFGFDGTNYNGKDVGTGSNTKLLNTKGWTGLLMDGGHDNPEINLHREFISDKTIVSLFAKYEVPLEPDYVSIDIDSCDIWVMLELTKVYRPRVITMEYNRNYPAGSMFAWPRDCSEQWQQDRVMSSSLGTIFAVARDAGYTVVHVIHETDAFLVRNDLAECLEVLPLWAHESRVLGQPIHVLSSNKTRAHILIDYERYKSSGGDMEASKIRSLDLLEYAPLLMHPQQTPQREFYD